MKDGTVKVLAVATVLAFMCMAFVCIDANNSNGNNVNESTSVGYAEVWSGTDGGVDWYYYEDYNNVVICPSENPEDGYESGVMKDYSDDNPAPWDPDNLCEVHCSALIIADGVKYIGAHAFESHKYHWQAIEGNVALPDTVTEIGPYAFNDCVCIWALTTSASKIDEGAFMGSGISGDLDLSKTDYIGDRAFCGCNNLETVTIGASYIGVAAFANCSGLKSVCFTNEYIDLMGPDMFLQCSSLTEISLEAVNSFGNISYYTFLPTLFVDTDGSLIENYYELHGMKFQGNFGFLMYRVS